MYVGLKIENFRSFSSLELSGLQSINLITGKNGSGKTAILEAVFLNAGACNSNLMMVINQLRGENFTGFLNDRPILSLFHNFTSSRSISILGYWRSTRDATTPANRDLGIRSIAADWKYASFPEGKLSGLQMDFKGSGQKISSKLRWIEEEVKQTWPGGRPQPSSNPQYNYQLNLESPQNKVTVGAAFVLASPRDALQQVYGLLVNAARDKNISKIVEFIRIIDSRLSGLVPLSEDGINTVYVDIGYSSLVPLTMMGNGFVDILHIACNIIQGGNRVILIDEIESGLHYLLYPELASGLIKLCRELEVQLFITTHSGEMVAAFAKQLEKTSFTDICALRVTRRGDVSIVTKFDSKDIGNSNEIDMDLR